MIFRTTILHCALIVASIAVGVGVGQSVLAGTTADDLEIAAGLQETLTVNCTQALSFGVTRVQLGDRGGSNDLFIAASGSAIGRTGSGNIVVGTTYANGVCQVSGAQGGDGEMITVVVSPGTVDFLGAETHGLSAPETVLDGLRIYNFVTHIPALVGGATTVNIGGRLIIPNNVNSMHLGGYSALVTVAVNDDPP